MTTNLDKEKNSLIRKLFENKDNLNEKDLKAIKKLGEKGYNDKISIKFPIK